MPKLSNRDKHLKAARAAKAKMVPAANMNLEFNASSQGGGGSSNGSNDATSSSHWNGETIVFDEDFGIAVEQMVASAISSPVWDTMLEIA